MFSKEKSKIQKKHKQIPPLAFVFCYVYSPKWNAFIENHNKFQNFFFSSENIWGCRVYLQITSDLKKRLVQKTLLVPKRKAAISRVKIHAMVKVCSVQWAEV